MRIRTPRRPGALALLVLAACAGGQTGDEGPSGGRDAGGGEDAAAPGGGFFDSFRDRFGNYDAARDVFELAERSERIVVGTTAGVHEGRPLLMSRADETTALFEVAVSETLKGDAAERQFIELYQGQRGFDSATVPDPLPQNRLLVFLIPQGDTHVSGGSPALPEGEPLYTLTTPQGLMVETEDGTVDAPDFPLLMDDFDAVVESVRDAMR